MTPLAIFKRGIGNRRGADHTPVDQCAQGRRAAGAQRDDGECMVVGGLMERRGRSSLAMRHAITRFNETGPDLVSDERNRFVRVKFEKEKRDA